MVKVLGGLVPRITCKSIERLSHANRLESKELFALSRNLSLSLNALLYFLLIAYNVLSVKKKKKLN